MKASDKLYLVLNKDETLYKNSRQEPMIYRHLETILTQERYADCKVAIFDLSEIVTIEKLNKKKKI
ncbi:hypothetical protein [Candidatus Stoquefichus massiliensis]|uniref:hypothetical protein n=1 Tax=Candidatus Stoquefichus massiliensis TaxID=1470350 RepID=UPI00047F47F0|nr:hypothetical protein [Candidatus Stoquefichus massiliensis]